MKFIYSSNHSDIMAVEFEVQFIIAERLSRREATHELQHLQLIVDILLLLVHKLICTWLELTGIVHEN